MSKKGGFLSIHSMKVLAKRELVSSLYGGWGIYLAIFISFIGSSLFLTYFLRGISEENIFISSYPLNFPLFLSVGVISLYLVIVSAISISREREQGTLEVLFYGPVSSSSFFLGKYLKDMILYLITLGFFAIYFFGVSLLTNLGFTYVLLKGFLLSIFVASCVISFGLFISSLTGRVRSSIIWLVGILLAFVVFNPLPLLAFWGMFMGPLPDVLVQWFVYLQKNLSIATQVINWVSPFSYLSRGMESISVGNIRPFLVNILYSIIYTAVLLILSIYILKLKGVKE